MKIIQAQQERLIEAQRAEAETKRSIAGLQQELDEVKRSRFALSQAPAR